MIILSKRTEEEEREREGEGERGGERERERERDVQSFSCASSAAVNASLSACRLAGSNPLSSGRLFEM